MSFKFIHFITNRLDDLDSETLSNYSDDFDKLTSIKSAGAGSLFQKADSSVIRQPYFTLNGIFDCDYHEDLHRE